MNELEKTIQEKLEKAKKAREQGTIFLIVSALITVIFVILQTLFIVFKVTSATTWSWIAVFCPTYIIVGMLVCLCLIFIIIYKNNKN